MKRLLLVLFASVALTGSALAQEPSTREEVAEAAPEADAAPVGADVDVVGTVTKLFEGIQNKNWVLVSAASILILVWIWNVFILPRVISSEKHPKWRKASPHISIGVAVVAQFAAAIIAGNEWYDALNTAVVTGFTASGMWSGGGKHVGNYVEKKLNGKVKPSPPEPPPAPSS